VRVVGAASLLALTVLAGCSNEVREIGPSLPQTSPAGNGDPRISAYQANLYQVSQGGRYFAWYGCSACHSDGAPGAANLADNHWRGGGGFADVYRAIAEHRPAPAYGDIIPPEQIWQITAHVRDLSRHYPEKRRRLSLDQKSEPHGSQWSGPQ
jgi:cytochrome c oxidase cbb3-type subunit III